MPLMKSTQSDLERELRILRRERDGLNETIAAFEAVLAQSMRHPSTSTDAPVAAPPAIRGTVAREAGAGALESA
jgi:hypothetical protein